MKKIHLVWLLALFATSCATNYVNMSVYEPPPVPLPKEIKSMGIVFRDVTSKEAKIMDKVDKVFSLESAKLDEIGAEACILGAYNEFSQFEQFELVKNLDTVQLSRPTLGGTPAALDWTIVEGICQKNQVDILIVLEAYDTDNSLKYATVPTSIKTPFGEIPGIEHHATATTIINASWRIYDPHTKLILDNFPVRERLVSVGKGINPVKALSAITNRKDLVKHTSTNMGIRYARRTQPFWPRVARDYYVAGNYNFKVAKRKAQTGNWDGAAEIWEKETINPKRKIMGRACYNMAIINEINGDIDGAIGWAQKAYEDCNNKLSLKYVKILRNRKARIHRSEQIEGD